MTRTIARLRRSLASLVAAVTLLASPGPAAESAVPPDAAAVIERHVAWLGGWKALDAVQDVTFAGTIRVSGLSGPLGVLARRGGKQKTEVDLKVMKGVEVLDGGGGWEQNASGQVEEMGTTRPPPRAGRSTARSAGTFAAKG